jgi:hypothetical protein
MTLAAFLQLNEQYLVSMRRDQTRSPQIEHHPRGCGKLSR